MSLVLEHKNIRKSAFNQMKLSVAKLVDESKGQANTDTFKSIPNFNDYELDLFLTLRRMVQVYTAITKELGIKITKILLHESCFEKANDFVFILKKGEKKKECYTEVFNIVKNIRKDSPNLKCMFIEDNNINYSLLKADGYSEEINL